MAALSRCRRWRVLADPASQKELMIEQEAFGRGDGSMCTQAHRGDGGGRRAVVGSLMEGIR